MGYVNNFFYYINIVTEEEKMMFGGLLIICLVALILRIYLSFGYQSRLAFVRYTSKNINSKDDIAKLKSGPFSRTAKEYAELGSKGVTRIDTKNIVEIDILRFNLMFWNYKSMGNFVESLETGILPLGILFTFIAETKQSFVVASVAVFIVAKLFAAIFDFKTARDSYVTNAAYTLDKEVGRFYVTDTSAAIMAFSNEIKVSLSKQSKILGDSISKMSGDLTDAVKISMSAMTKNIEATMTSISSYGDTLQKPMENWKDAIAASRDAQNKINSAVDTMNDTINRFASAMGAAGNTINDYRNEISNHSNDVKNEIAVLSESLLSLKEISANISQRNDVFKEELQTVKTNQRALETSIAQYETTLKEITTQMGDALGRMVDFHLQGAYNAMNEGVTENLKQIATGNNELLLRLQSLFAQMEEQSRMETTAIKSLKEQMDIHFEDLKDDIKQEETRNRENI